MGMKDRDAPASGDASPPIYQPTARPMEVVFFASGGPGNFAAAVETAARHPTRMRVSLLVTDRPGTPAAALARQKGIEVHEYDFEQILRSVTEAGQTPELARERANVTLNQQILDGLVTVERTRGVAFDLAVLAYRRIFSGPLLERFDGRAINQHPADLAIREGGVRAYRGIGGHSRALKRGLGGARTCTILIREGLDAGEILCRGPFVPFSGDRNDVLARREHENLQKELSDWPSLEFALIGLAIGRFTLSSETHDDGCAVVRFGDVDLPYGGVEVCPETYQSLLQEECPDRTR